MRKKTLAVLLGVLLPLAMASAADWYVATGKPIQRSQLNSADFRTEFAAIQTAMDKLPALTGNGDKIIVVNAGGTALSTLTGGLPVASGGTGSTTASAARTALGLAIGTDVQAYDADLLAIAAITELDSNFLVGSGSGWVLETGATVRTSLGLGSLAVLSAIDDDNWDSTDLSIGNGGTGASTAANARTALGLIIDTDVQGYDADLAALEALAKTDSNFIVGNGSTWVAETGATARTSLGLGSLATLSAIDDDNWDSTDLAIANGGTGASTAGGALTALGGDDAANLSTGELPDARLSSNIPLLDANNTFASNYQILEAATPQLRIHETDANVDEGEWSIRSASGNFGMTAFSDGWLSSVLFFEATTTGATISQINLTSTALRWNTNALFTTANDGTGSNLDADLLDGQEGSFYQTQSAVLDAITASFLTADETKLDGIEALADVTDATNVAAAGAPIITAGAGAPSSTPATEGDVYIDTTGDNTWMATGSASSADWKQATGAGGGDLLAANNLSDLINDATARTNLGLAIGVNVQAFDTDLTTWAGITPSANVQSLVGAATYAAIRTLLDLEVGTDFYSISAADAAFEAADATILKDADLGVTAQAYDADLLAIAALAKTDNNFMVATGAAWALETPAAARSSLGLGTLALVNTVANGQWSGADLTVSNGGTGVSTLTGLLKGNGTGAITGSATVNNSNWSGTDLAVGNGGTGASTLTGLLSGNGTGAITGSATINNGNWSGTDLAVANGGTGASDATQARVSLGVVIGTDVQAYDPDLTTIGGLSKTNNNFMVANGSAWVLETASQARTSLGLLALALQATINNSDWSGTDLAIANGGTASGTASGARTNLGVAIGTNVQAYDAGLLAIGNLATTNNNFIVANGSTWALESASAARTSLGVDTNDLPQLGGVNVGHSSDSTLTRKSAGELEVEGRPILAHDNTAYVSAHIIVTSSTPTDTSGMASGDIKLVY